MRTWTAVLCGFAAGCSTPAAGPASDPPGTEPTRAGAMPSAEPQPGLTREEIRLVVRAKLSEVRGCFERGLAVEPSLGGRVSLRFTISSDGRVRDAAVVEDELGHEVATCLIEQTGHWQFPRPTGGREVSVVYPFNFTSEDVLRAAGVPRVEGTLRPAAVGLVFGEHRTELDSCVQAGASSGRLGVAFTIDDTGTVTKISAYDSTLSEPVTRCIVRTVAGWQFPSAAAGDEVRVNHELEW